MLALKPLGEKFIVANNTTRAHQSILESLKVGQQDIMFFMKWCKRKYTASPMGYSWKSFMSQDQIKLLVLTRHYRDTISQIVKLGNSTGCMIQFLSQINSKKKLKMARCDRVEEPSTKCLLDPDLNKQQNYIFEMKTEYRLIRIIKEILLILLNDSDTVVLLKF